MADRGLDTALEEALAFIVSQCGDGDRLVSVPDADHLVYDELKRRGYLDMVEYDLTGNAIVRPSYRAFTNFREPAVTDVVLPSSGKTKLFETFGDTYIRVKGIGNGGAGDVYEVVSAGGEHYALKLLSADAARNTSKLKRFLQEARFARDGKCPYVVRAMDFGCVGTGDVKRPFYIMPLMAGSLADLMKRPEDYPRDVLTKMLLELMEGLNSFYAAGNYHRDIKPQNLLYDAESKSLLLSDLGIAHIETSYPGATVETVSSDRLANFQYAAPEQRIKGGICDQRTDLYSFGLILNELFTGVVPQGANYKRIAELNPGLAYLDDVVDRMISQDPEERYSTLDAALLDVKARSKMAASEAMIQDTLSSEPEDDIAVVQVIGRHWENGAVLFALSDKPEDLWLHIFKGYGQTSFSTDGFYLDPKKFQYSSSTIAVPKVGYDKTRAKQAAEYIDQVVGWANSEYARKIKFDRQRDYEESLNKRRAELERARKDAELGGAINDMLAGM